jgi:SAM-dependent methyltransferase
MPERVSCNLCGADDAPTLYVLRDYRFSIDDIDWPVVRCRNCGLAYVNPRPTIDEISRYYPEQYFAHRGGLQRRYQRQVAYLPTSPGRLLDIGTGRGDFLALMRDRGWEVEGLEPFAPAANPDLLTIHRTFFPDNCDLPDQQFDVITAWAVFEHLHDPLGAFRESARLLRPGGSLIVEVPNLRSVRGWFSRMEDIPRHLYLFSPGPLAQYGRRVGLRLETVHHVTDLFSDASGAEAVRYLAARSLGISTAEFFRIYRTPRRERFRTWPVTSAVLAAAGLGGRILLSNWLVRVARISGEIVAIYCKPGVDATFTRSSTSGSALAQR